MSKRHALIIEDSPTMRQLITLACKGIAELAMLEANNGAEALEALQTHDIDIILLDLNMPVMNGFAFLEKLRDAEMANKPPVVVITTRGDQESIEKATALGATAYVTKPVQATDMAAVIEQALNNK